ncbi:Eco57I restriction-modification methylase domain-containing protein [[Mycoplasma] anseris]|uniref:SAM-dependent methyltransferase n=1 Tax=[Mycoplasma] anseris TaxID=92400 RepID=A0A2Z4NCT6_9BACT|nr:SAM-dependent methyltransferase [[Mycoplasma] anseris]AWX69369.1 SAM-dependent methyltransferase [[Mycoplasma] anseris]
MSKITNGQFFTERNVFENNKIFFDFMNKNDLWNKKILEPFAGSNNLIHFLLKYNQNLKYESYDIDSQNKEVKQNDSIQNWIYENFDLVVTNPPYLSKHSARRMKLNVDFQNYDDLYKLSLDRCISNVRFTIAIIPTTLINSNRKEDRKLINKLVIFQLLPNKQNFSDTEHPVALAYFDHQKQDEDFLIYEDNKLIGSFNYLLDLENTILKPQNDLHVAFNIVGGNLCINASDNTKDKENIKFYLANWKEDSQVKITDRHKVKLMVKDLEINHQILNKLNNKINELRKNNCDYLWSSFKGVSETGNYRKRIDFKTIKKIINTI